MPRKPVYRSLPPLEEVYSGSLPFKEQDNHFSLLTDALRRIARSLQKQKGMTFYAQQEVARFFQVPLRTVGLAYGHLQREGLLICRRGSSTQLTGRVRRPARPVRGVVGLPVWRHGFNLLPWWSRFFTVLEDELRALDFVADLVFFGGEEGASAPLELRLLDHNLDHLVWLHPLTASQQTLLRLADRGVSCLTLQFGSPSPPLGGIQLEYEPAWREALAAWQSEGVRDLISITPKTPVFLEGICRESGLHLHPAWDLSESEMARLPSKAGVVFPHDIALSLISRQHPALITRLLRQRRVLALESLPLFHVPSDLRLDLVAQDWDAIARTVADMIADSASRLDEQPVIAQARFLPKANPRDARFGYISPRSLAQEQLPEVSLLPLLNALNAESERSGGNNLSRTGVKR